MTVSRLLELPSELQVRILSNLDAKSILACRQASPELEHTIDDTLELQYQLELELAGMVDGPPGPASIRDRLDALRAYRRAWDAGEHPVQRISTINGFNTHIGPLIFWIEAITGSLRIYRPPETFCGLAERELTFEGMEVQVASYPGYYSFVIDPAQDLLVYCWDTSPAPIGHTYAKCAFASLSQNYQAHPLASRSFTSCLPVTAWGTYASARCRGDLVEWTVGCGENAHAEMMVINWKTGIIIWVSAPKCSWLSGRHFAVANSIIQHMHGTSGQDAMRLISDTHVLVVNDLYSPSCSLRIYAFDPSASADAPLVTEDNFLHTLELPSCTDAVCNRSVRVQFQSSPAFAEDDRPLFLHDPHLSLLVLTINLYFRARDFSGDSPTGEFYLLLVPLETLLRARLTTGDRPPRGSVIPWEDWGPQGTRMLRIEEHTQGVSSLGSRIALHNGWAGYAPCTVTVYEVHKLANESIPASAKAGDDQNEDARNARMAAAVAAGPVVSDDDWITDSIVWKNPIHTTYPFRKTVRVIPPSCSPPEGPWNSMVRLTSDGLIQVTQVLSNGA
ncbi:hypothetical protein FKP32DRAFT_1606257 [Trametes sanguinea]|nr:hypothetical protein FKP32DRAFT_1606257 [Trametes sanguinea]